MADENKTPQEENGVPQDHNEPETPQANADDDREYDVTDPTKPNPEEGIPAKDKEGGYDVRESEMQGGLIANVSGVVDSGASIHDETKAKPQIDWDRVQEAKPGPFDNFRQYAPIARRVGFWLLIVAILIFTLFPFYYAVVGSFKSEAEIRQPATLLPQNPTTINYYGTFEDNITGETNARGVFSSDQFLRGLFNSTVVSGVTVVLALVVGSFAAYALGRLKFAGRTLMLYLVLAMTMFPQVSILSGLFQITRELGVFGSISSLIITYPIFTLPFTVWVLTSFFQGLPGELEQAALVDGATPFQTFYMILLPLTAPALVTTGLLAFIAAWNEYLLALTFTSINASAQTVPVVIANFSGTVPREEPIAEVLAAAVVVTIPLVVLVLIFQNRIVAGLTAGAVKG